MKLSLNSRVDLTFYNEYENNASDSVLEDSSFRDMLDETSVREEDDVREKDTEEDEDEKKKKRYTVSSDDTPMLLVAQESGNMISENPEHMNPEKEGKIQDALSVKSEIGREKNVRSQKNLLPEAAKREKGDGADVKVGRIQLGEENVASDIAGANLLKKLAARQSNYAVAAASGKNQDLKQLEVQQARIKENIAESVESMLEQSAKITADAGDGAEFSSFREGHDTFPGNSDRSFPQYRVSGMNSMNNGSAPNVTVTSPNTFSGLNTGVQYVQEIVAKLQHGLLRGGEGVDPKGTLKMDLQVNGLGSLTLSLQQSGDSIRVSMQTGSESAKDQLMDQREEFERQMRDLGYENVNFDISFGSGDGRSDDSFRHQQEAMLSGNALNLENVKLSGNAAADRTAALNF